MLCLLEDVKRQDQTKLEEDTNVHHVYADELLPAEKPWYISSRHFDALKAYYVRQRASSNGLSETWWLSVYIGAPKIPVDLMGDNSTSSGSFSFDVFELKEEELSNVSHRAIVAYNEFIFVNQVIFIFIFLY